VDITVYLPDDIGKRAKAAEPELNLSRLLRDAVTAELDRRARLAGTLKGAKEHELSLETDEGATYLGVLTGVEIAENVYMTTDERLLIYDADRGQLHTYENYDLDDLRRELDDESYIAVCDALGETARVEV
jgi:small nuclear ribonucleoprotein (snRNP)-like protein